MAETQTLAAFKPPDIPSKWDIIPIHSSDRGSFKRCRRYWDWNSPARHNLVVRADIHGVSKPLWFGTGIHYALEQYYRPGLSRDPVETWKTWFDIQWRGGVVTEEWLDLVYDLNPQQIKAAHIVGDDEHTWQVRGLEDILPDPDHEAFDELYELGINMMIFYKDYAEKHDEDYHVLMTEHDFSVPIWDPINDDIMKRIDRREDSPNYGRVLEVHARGRQDLIYMRISNERMGIWDHKTAAKIDEDYFFKLETDEQCTNYLWAAQIEANYYGLPWKGDPFEEVLYQALRKNFPKPPTELKNGMFSVNRTEESTTYDILMPWIAKHLPGVTFNEKQQEYINWLKDVGDEQFIIRRSVRRSQAVLASAGFRIFSEACDMLQMDEISDEIRATTIYPNITNDWLCKNCTFRVPCLLKEEQGDWETYLTDNYTTNKDR